MFKQMIMFDRKKTKQILYLSIPIIGGMMSQNILNLVDTLMIGRLGTLALAGSGVGAFLFFVSFAGFTGVSNAVQTMVARFKGQQQTTKISIPFYLGLVSTVLVASMFTLIAYNSSTTLIALFTTETAVLQIGADYFKYRILGLPLFCVCLVVRGLFNGLSKPTRYLRIIVIIHTLNIIFNYLLIFGALGFPKMGAAGAGLASTLSLIIGTILYIIDCRSYLGLQSFFETSRHTLLSYLRWMIRLSIPSSIQQWLFALGIAVLFWILSLIGTNALAIGNVLINIVLVGILPAVGFGMAAMTLVSESLGKKQYQAAYQWPFDVGKLSLLTIGIFGLLIIVYPRVILKPFIIDPIALESAILPLQLDCIGVILEAGTLVFMNALLGADRTMYVMWVSIICQWMIYLPLAYLFGITLEYGLTGVWGMWIIFQLLQCSLFAGYWIIKMKSRR